MTEVVRSVQRMLDRSGPLLKRLPAGPCVAVEVGTSGGLMAEHLLKTRRDLTLHCVDNWLGRPYQPKAYIQSGDSHAALSQIDADGIKRIAETRLKPFAGRCVIHHMHSLKAALSFVVPVDLVFLDADHSREGVAADIAAWWSHVRPGGWLGGHDYKNQDPRFNFGVEHVVDEWTKREGHKLELASGLTWWVRKP